ncbi:class I SAM-dependent methyltransferase [Lentilitoribacter sp. Alg239-R112]|uniref:class I SAM-dependent methyltransferase n=1 Tax=Lentilitoribacter sp. Alg239-R112 TaxID=2305987 RepID=UPI0013A68E71|nr:class I SAM-dependent methyltransferase [Lentilitoribacter sp. Alg239-R112]
MTCYLCNYPHFEKCKGRVRDAPNLEFRRCSACELVYLETVEHIKAGHYEESGMHDDALFPIEAWLRQTAEDDQRRIDNLRPMLVNRSILDFGCGAGGFIQRATNIAASVTGLELEKRVREYWGKQYEIYESLNQVGKFDIITAFHVVEHLADPRAILSQLAEHLNKNGQLIIEVPSADDALLTLYDNQDFQNFTYWSQHLFLFNADTMRQLAKQAGLEVVSIQQHQRYSLANHLHWLSHGKPGGHQKWAFLDNPELSRAYASALGSIGKSDTIIAYLQKAK